MRIGGRPKHVNSIGKKPILLGCNGIQILSLGDVVLYKHYKNKVYYGEAEVLHVKAPYVSLRLIDCYTIQGDFYAVGSFVIASDLEVFWDRNRSVSASKLELLLKQAA